MARRLTILGYRAEASGFQPLRGGSVAPSFAIGEPLSKVKANERSLTKALIDHA
jgi:hypothetical protein